jgi:hypothetical protein
MEAERVGNVGRSGRWGLHGMRERAKLIGVQFEMWSYPGTGIEVESTRAVSAYRSRLDPNNYLRSSADLAIWFVAEDAGRQSDCFPKHGSTIAQRRPPRPIARNRRQ